MVNAHGRVVTITGAAGGIGQALCRHFGRQGDALIALDRSESVVAFADELATGGVRVEAVVADIADAAGVRMAIERGVQRFGLVEVLINNAGATSHPLLDRTSPEAFASEIAVNLTGAFHCCHVVLPGMKARGAGVIVNVGSVNGLSALGDAAYSAGKAGLISLTKSIAIEYGRYNIRANVVCPGTVRTPIWNERALRHPEVLTQLTRWYPLRRIVEPEDVANAVAFLASDAAAAITGIALPVDCGLSAGNVVMARELTLEDL